MTAQSARLGERVEADVDSATAGAGKQLGTRDAREMNGERERETQRGQGKRVRGEEGGAQCGRWRWEEEKEEKEEAGREHSQHRSLSRASSPILLVSPSLWTFLLYVITGSSCVETVIMRNDRLVGANGVAAPPPSHRPVSAPALPGCWR